MFLTYIPTAFLTGCRLCLIVSGTHAEGLHVHGFVCIVEHSVSYSGPVRPLTSTKLLFYFLHYVVLLSSCVHNLQRMEQGRRKHTTSHPLPAGCLCPVHCLKELNLAETKDAVNTCTYLFIRDCREEARDQNHGRSTFLPQVVSCALSLNYSLSLEQGRNNVVI